MPWRETFSTPKPNEWPTFQPNRQALKSPGRVLPDRAFRKNSNLKDLQQRRGFLTKEKAERSVEMNPVHAEAAKSISTAVEDNSVIAFLAL